MKEKVLAWMLAAVLCVVPALAHEDLAPGSAINTGKLAFLIPNLYGSDGLNLPNPAHRAHFDSAFQSNFGPFNSALGSQLSTLPIPSPASGFLYNFDPALGIYVRSAQSFGPILAERAETIGREKFYFGFSLQRFSFDNIDGHSLRSIPTVFEHAEVANLNYRRDFISTVNFVDMQLSQFTTFMTYGVTDRLDFSFAFPLMSANMNVVSDATIRRIGTTGDPDLPHTFELGADRTFNRFAASGSASGIGDIVARLKGTAARSSRMALGLAVDMRFPTGDEYDFLGTGSYGIKPFAVASFNLGRLAPHINVGYQWNGDSVLGGDIGGNVKGPLPDSLQYAIGADLSVSQAFTVAVDYLGKHLFDASQVQLRTFTNFEGTVYPQFQQLHFERGGVNQSDVSIGFKAAVIGRLLLTGNALVRLNRGGLRDKVVPLIGISYTP